MLDRETMEKCAPVFEFASHTHNLHRATGTGHSALTDADPAMLEKDLSASLDALRPFAGSTLTVFSYPYGFYNDRVVDALKARGIRIAFRATGGHLNRNSDRIPSPAGRYPIRSAWKNSSPFSPTMSPAYKKRPHRCMCGRFFGFT